MKKMMILLIFVVNQYRNGDRKRTCWRGASQSKMGSFDDFYIKKHCSECGAAAPQHWEGATQSEEGASSPLGVGGSPLLTGSHLQLGGTLVP